MFSTVSEYNITLAKSFRADDIRAAEQYRLAREARRSSRRERTSARAPARKLVLAGRGQHAVR